MTMLGWALNRQLHEESDHGIRQELDPGVEALGFNLAQKCEGDDFVAHGMDQVGIGGSHHAGGIGCVAHLDPLRSLVGQYGQEPAAPGLRNYKEARLCRAADRKSALMMDCRKNDSNANGETDHGEDREDRLEGKVDARIHEVRVSELENRRHHGRQQGDAKSRFRVEEADSVLRIADCVVEKQQTAGEIGLFIHCS